MYTRELVVLPSDASSDGKLKLRGLLDYFQDTAGLAVEDLEGTATELYSRGYAWVLARYEINFTLRLPRFDEKFILNTFHDPLHAYNSLRCFEVNALDGTRLIDAKSSWLLVDVRNGRPVKPAAHIPDITKRDNQEISPDFEEIPEINDAEIVKSVNFSVRYHDLDYNSHVNNANYFAWVYDECPVNFENYELKKICASFRSGAKLGENIRLEFARKSENFFVCRIMRPEVKKPSAEFSLLWGEK